MNFSRAVRPSDATSLTLGARICRPASAGWHALCRWSRRRSTLRRLGALDERTLRDIGLAPGEIESLAYGDTGDRRHHIDWQGKAPH